MKQLLDGILCCLIGYILGNFCPAYLFGKIKGYDIRKEGSGNVGAPRMRADLPPMHAKRPVCTKRYLMKFP